MFGRKDIFDKFPVIELDDKYVLREQKSSDARDFFAYYTDPEVKKTILSYMPVSIEDAKMEVKYWADYFKEKRGVYWGIARKSDDKLIGSIGYTNWVPQYNRAEISYDLAKEYWNKGLMTKAIKKVLDFGFNDMELNKVQAFSVVDNPASQKVLTKSGFAQEGFLKQDRFSKGKYWDIVAFGLTKDDYQNLAK